MNKLLCAALVLLACAAIAQEAKPPADDLEPGVNTSAPAQAPAARPAAASAPVPAANAPANKPAAPKSTAKDRLDLDSTQITGNRELPKVLYIVPWRNAELGDLVGPLRLLDGSGGGFPRRTRGAMLGVRRVRVEPGQLTGLLKPGLGFR